MFAQYDDVSVLGQEVFEDGAAEAIQTKRNAEKKKAELNQKVFKLENKDVKACQERQDFLRT